MNENKTLLPLLKKLPFWIKALLLVWLFLGIFPLLSISLGIEKAFGVQYIPSAEWTSQIYIPATISGIIHAILLVWGVFKGLAIIGNGMGKFKKYGAMIAAPLMGF